MRLGREARAVLHSGQRREYVTLEVGRPPHAYLEQIRINHAKALLLKGCPISQIAMETGYVDQSHFANRFKCFVGVTPRQFAQSQQ
ncbi:MAG: helix-turn-helix transcriptional regulator [Leptolyngbyaceae cyanobacterium SM1_4_3]|nr:helix-turn-helix transcriptional regulator [Leptolyngbyaceae cyanobacterium SM1_4_3]